MAKRSEERYTFTPEQLKVNRSAGEKADAWVRKTLPGLHPDAIVPDTMDALYEGTRIPFTNTSLIGFSKDEVQQAGSVAQSVRPQLPSEFTWLNEDESRRLGGSSKLSDMATGNPMGGVQPDEALIDKLATSLEQGGGPGIAQKLALAAAAAYLIARGRGKTASRLMAMGKTGKAVAAAEAAAAAAPAAVGPAAKAGGLWGRVPKKYVAYGVGGAALAFPTTTRDIVTDWKDNVQEVFDPNHRSRRELDEEKAMARELGLELYKDRRANALLDRQIREEERRGQEDRAMAIFSQVLQSAMNRQAASDEAAIEMMSRYNDAVSSQRTQSLIQMLAQ